MSKQTVIVRKKIGKVVSVKNINTATVVVDNIKEHRLYHKKYTISKKYLCENPDNKFQVNDMVEIVPCRPLSRRKHYLISKKIND